MPTSIKKRCFYIHLDLLLYGGSYCENPFVDEKFNHANKSLVEMHSATWEYIFATNYALCLAIAPNASFLVQNTH
jgi:hypothetical protein